MRKIILIFGLVAAIQLMAQEKSSVTVKSTELNNGVVIVNIHPATEAHTAVLQCNKDMPDCKAPKAGTYTMVRLPKNYGMYDCVNVDLFPNGQENGDKIGEYCLMEK